MSFRQAVAHAEVSRDNIVRVFLDRTTKEILVGVYFVFRGENEFGFKDNIVPELEEYFNCFHVDIEAVTEVYLLEKKFTKDRL